MATIGETPKFKTIDELPYIISLKMKVLHAKDFTPHKVEYYQEQVNEAKARLSEDSMKELLINNDYKVTRGDHGLIFVTPINKGNNFTKTFDSIKEAYNHYLNPIH